MNFNRRRNPNGSREEWHLLAFWPVADWSAVIFANDGPEYWIEPIAGWARIVHTLIFPGGAMEQYDYLTGMGTSDGGELEDLADSEIGYVSRYVLTGDIDAADKASWAEQARNRWETIAPWHERNTHAPF